MSTAIEKFAGKGQIPPVGTVPLLVIIVASALILVGVALFGAGLRWFFSLRPESHPDAIRNGSLLGAALLVFGFSATLLALVPPLVFRADVASPRPCPKCPMVEAMKAEKIEAFPLDEIDDLGDGSRPEDKVIEPRKLQKLKGDLREKSAKAGDILLLLGSADCVATKKGGLWRNNEDLAKARADWVNHSLGGQEEVKDIKIKSLPLPQHARCGPARNVRAVFPFLIHPENN